MFVDAFCLVYIDNAPEDMSTRWNLDVCLNDWTMEDKELELRVIQEIDGVELKSLLELPNLSKNCKTFLACRHMGSYDLTDLRKCRADVLGKIFEHCKNRSVLISSRQDLSDLPENLQVRVEGREFETAKTFEHYVKKEHTRLLLA